MDTVNYKCPNCSAGLAFDSKSQKMKCEYCGNAYSLEELEQLAEQQDTVKEDTTTHWEGQCAAASWSAISICGLWHGQEDTRRFTVLSSMKVNMAG